MKGLKPTFSLQPMTKKKPRYNHNQNFHDEWYTPEDLFEYLNLKFGPFTLDPFATEESHLCPTYITKEQDAFKTDWGDHLAFCNPPYSIVAEAIKHCVMNPYEGWFLVNALTANGWFHKWVAPHCDELYFFRGKISFNENLIEKRKRLKRKYKDEFTEAHMKENFCNAQPSIFLHIPRTAEEQGEPKWGVLARSLKEDGRTLPPMYHLPMLGGE